MGLSFCDGLDRICGGTADLLWVELERSPQHHIDVVGRCDEVLNLFDWCSTRLGPPAAWLPCDDDAQWFNRFDTDVIHFSDRAWSYCWSPWIGGDVENLHLVIWDASVVEFCEYWKPHRLG